MQKTKSKKIIFLGLILLSLLCGRVNAQQEPMYSQYMFNMLHINPAYAGHRAVNSFTLLGRNQWVGLAGAPKTVSASWDARSDESNVGYGAQVYYDQLGIEKTTGIQGFYSYQIPFNNSSLTFGVSGGVLNYRAAYTEAAAGAYGTHPIDPGDPLFQQDASGWLPTAGFGMLYSAERWYVGLSVPALLHTKVQAANYVNQSSTGADNHYFLTGGYIFNLSQAIKLKPSMLIKAVRGAPIEYDFNLNGWLNDVIGLGISYRTGDAVVGMFEVQITPKVRLGYAYDYTISDLKSYNRGTHELMLRFEMPKSGKREKTYSPRYY